jgi:hypothetical protein
MPCIFLGELIERHALAEGTLIIPTLHRLDDIRREIELGTGRLCLQELLPREIPSLLSDEEGIGPLEPRHGSCSFSKVKAIRSVKLDAVRQISLEQILLALTVDLVGLVSVSADWDDYIEYSDVREFFGSGEGDPFSYIDVGIDVQVTVGLSLIVHTDSLSVLSAELDSYSTEFGSAEINPHPNDAGE